MVVMAVVSGAARGVLAPHGRSTRGRGLQAARALDTGSTRREGEERGGREREG